MVLMLVVLYWFIWIVFERQARKAVELGKPLVVHSRKAAEDTLRILKDTLPQDWKVHVSKLL